MGVLRCMRSRTRRRCGVCCTLVSIVVILIVWDIYRQYREHACSPAESQHFISTLCDIYHHDNTSGSMCQPLCDDHGLIYTSCADFHRQKHVVFMQCSVCDNKTAGSVIVVLKTKSFMEKGGRQEKHVQILESSVNLEEIFKKMRMKIIATVKEFGLDFPNKKEPLSYVWDSNISNYSKDPQQTQAVLVDLESMVSLIEQREYMFLKYLHDMPYVPQIYGECGPVYFVEHTKSLWNHVVPHFFADTSSWEVRASIAIRLIELMRRLDTEFQAPLHLCDIKPDNFGIRAKTNDVFREMDAFDITIIDLDSAIFEDKLTEQFVGTKCSSHGDCDEVDCRGYCDSETSRCLPARVNSNMQSLCKDIFSEYLPIIPSGLLRDPPPEVKGELFKTVRECSRLDRENGKQRMPQPAWTSVALKLEYLLRNSLEVL